MNGLTHQRRSIRPYGNNYNQSRSASLVKSPFALGIDCLLHAEEFVFSGTVTDGIFSLGLLGPENISLKSKRTHSAQQRKAMSMNFQSVNPLNVRLNKVSGNLLPVTADGSSFPIYWQVYAIVIWIMEIIQMSILIPGCFQVPMQNALKDGMIGIAITLEVFFIVIRLHLCKGLIERLINRLNDIMLLDDELMRNTVRTTIKSMDKPLKFCWLAGVVSIILWCSPPYALIFQKDLFVYLDYKMPVAFGTEPFSTGVFVVGSLIVSISSAYIFTKKIAVDTYMINLVLLVTAQYRYISLKLSLVIRDRSPENNLNGPVEKERYFEIDRYVKEQVKSLCRHHNTMLYVTLILKQLLSLNFSLIYINNVFRFCCIAFMILVVSSMDFVEGSGVILYACGGVVQLYLLCYCVQQLLDAVSIL
ncbi:uncharacterized protein LOC109504567 [Harpegnathos saltator]|uniref:uncharacterized protein LOC109504567 n=1 Tax=Harpegnathos saltator TaxID=610380 RepID=UPI000DBED2CD|nr:uncharacterized protein LOC109504567 [Harpegnathos saltator]